MRKNKDIGVLWFTVIIVVILWTLFPLCYAILNSFKATKDIFSASFIPFLQFTPTLKNWSELWIKGPEIQNAFKNSIMVSLTSTGLVLLLGVLTGYSLSCYQFKKIKNESISLWFLSLRILPPYVVFIPYLLTMKRFHLIDTPIALILVYTVFLIPFSILIMRDMFSQIPSELKEAATIDGCSDLGLFTKIYLPLALPGFAAAGLICFALSWNELFFAVVLTAKRAVTIPVIVSGGTSIRGADHGFIAAISLVAIIPPVIVALLFQRFIVKGLTLGAVKG